MSSCLFAAVVAALSGANRTKEGPTGVGIAALVRQLGDDTFEKREAAARALRRAGAPALAAVRRATTSGDPEVRRRARPLAELIEREATERAAAKLAGEWVLVAEEKGGKGKKWPSSGFVATVKVSGGRVTFHSPLGPPLAVTFPDFSRSDRVDLSIVGQTWKCAYRLDGDRLLLAWPGATCARPVGWKTRPDDGRLVQAFRRRHAVPPCPEPPGQAVTHPLARRPSR